MVHWKDPHTMAMEAVDFNNMVHALCGLYIWELIVTFDFEISIIRGKRKVGWAIVRYASTFLEVPGNSLIHFKAPFFLSRYGMLWALVGLVISMNVSTELNCGALYTFISVAGNTTIASASTSLMIRTVALWEWKRWVAITIGILSLGQWAILIRTMTVVQAVWDDSNNSCVVDNTNHLLLNLNYSYTMTFDFIILLFTTVILRRYSQPNAGLSGLLFRDGLIYFLVTSMCNTVPAVLNLLNLNDEMNVIATVPAATASAVAACRAVIRLREYGERGNSYSLPSLSFLNTIADRYRKSSVPQTHRRTNAFSLEEFGTRNAVDTFHDHPNGPKLPNYVEFTPMDGTVNSVDSVLKKTDESQAIPSKDNTFVSPV